MSIETVARRSLYRQAHARGGDLRSLANRTLLRRIWRFSERHHRRLGVSVGSALSLADVVGDMPDGLDTVVGERGYRLPGGQRQRLTIARLLLGRSGVVVLDEATASLDSASEAAVQQALAEALAGRTSIVIAHRLSTVRAADVILVVEDGRIIERGTHDQLLARGGRYTELYETRFAAKPTPTMS